MHHANKISNWLLEQKVDIDQPSSHAKTPLMYAAHFKNTEMFIRLLQEGADTKQRTDDNRSVEDCILLHKNNPAAKAKMMEALNSLAR